MISYHSYLSAAFPKQKSSVPQANLKAAKQVVGELTEEETKKQEGKDRTIGYRTPEQKVEMTNK